MDVPDEDRRRVYLWMDLNIPYYGTSSSNHPAELGSRRMLPLDLDATLSEVASRRCVQCHQGDIPRKFYTRVMNVIKPLNMKSTDFELAARASLVALEAGVADASHLVNCYVLADMAHRLGGEDYVLTHGYNIKRLCDEIFAQDYKARPLQVAAMRASAGDRGVEGHSFSPWRGIFIRLIQHNRKVIPNMISGLEH